MSDVNELIIQLDSKVSEVKDYVLYHRYMSSDFNYSNATEQLLWEAETILDAWPDDDVAPHILVQKLIQAMGREYGWA